MPNATTNAVKRRDMSRQIGNNVNMTKVTMMKARADIGLVIGWNDAQRGSKHFNCREDAHLLAAHADIIPREDHHPGVGNSFAKADQNVTQKQAAHRRTESAQALPKIPTLRFRSNCCGALCPLYGVFAQLALHKNRDRGEDDGGEKADAHAGSVDPEPIDQYSAQDWRDHDGQSFDDHLNAHALEWRFASSVAPTSERVAGSEKQLRKGKGTFPPSLPPNAE